MKVDMMSGLGTANYSGNSRGRGADRGHRAGIRPGVAGQHSPGGGDVVVRGQSVSICGVQVKEGKVLAQDRYMSNLFFIAPVYHLAFTLLPHLTVIDGTDLEFHQDLAPLQAELSHLTGGKLMGMGLDLSPNYFHMLTKYRDAQRRNFATFSLSPVGFPGQYQVVGRFHINSIFGWPVQNKFHS